MSKEHLITPPPNLFKQWEDDILNERDNVDHVLDYAWKNGFQVGADQELEACCKWLETGPYAFSIEATVPSMTKRLRADRRPKLLSKKERALDSLLKCRSCIDDDLYIDIKEAIESLPDEQ